MGWVSDYGQEQVGGWAPACVAVGEGGGEDSEVGRHTCTRMHM